MSDEDTFHALHQALNVLADEVGLREANVKGHQQNAAQIARTIAQIMRVDEDTIEGIRIAATLHDCGFLREGTGHGQEDSRARAGLLVWTVLRH